MKNLSIQVVLCILFCEGCSTYSKISIPIQQAHDIGNVKVNTTTGKTMKFDMLGVADGLYYGIKGENKTILSDDIAGVYPSIKGVHKVWVHETNTKAITTGYLYSLSDSSLQISPSMILLEEQIAATQNTSIPVSNIQWIKSDEKGPLAKGMRLERLPESVLAWD